MHALNMKSLSVCPHGVVSITPQRVVHKESERNVERHGSGKAPAVRRRMTLDVAGASSSLGVNEPSF